MNARLRKGAREAPSAQELHVSLQTPSAMQRVEPAWCLLLFLSKGHGEREANTNCAPAGLDSQSVSKESPIGSSESRLVGLWHSPVVLGTATGQEFRDGHALFNSYLRLLTQCLGHHGELAKRLLVLSNHAPVSLVHWHEG